MMPVLIGVTPAVHDKFRNYKHSSSFRDKSDAELLEYFLDSFEVITCILDLGARSSPSSSSPPPDSDTIPHVLPFPITPQPSQTSHPTRERVPSARKSTPSISKAKKSTSATCSRPLERQTSSETSPTPSQDSTADEYVRNWRASIRRSIRISSSPSKPRPVRRKSIQNTGGPRKPPPLAIEPMPVVKTEPVDPSDVIEEQMSVPLANVLSKYHAKMNSSSTRSSDTTPVVVPDSSVVPNSSALSDSSVDPNSCTEDTFQVEESITESYDADSIKKTLRLQCKTTRNKNLFDKAQETFEFCGESETPPNPRPRETLIRAPAPRTIAQLLVDAANYDPNSSQTESGIAPTPSIPDQNNDGPISNGNFYDNLPGKRSSYAGFLTSSRDHSYTKKRSHSSQQKQTSSKPFILTIKPYGHKDVASAISSGKPIAPRPISVVRNGQTNASCSTKTTATFNCSRERTATIKPTSITGRNFVGSGPQNIGCNVCYRMFDTKADFQRHIKTVSTSKEFDPLTHRRIRVPNEGSQSVLFCKMCNTAFVDRGALEEHLANNCMIFPGASSYSVGPSRRVCFQGGNVTPTHNRTIRIFNVSQVPSQNTSSPNITPATLDSPAQKRSLPDTPPMPKKRSSSDLFSQTCALCNQKFCECLIANKKYKNNYQRKSFESAPKTDPLNFPFPFDLEATRAPVEKENSSRQANNLSLANSHWEKLLSQAPEKCPPASGSDQAKSDNLLSKFESETVKLSSEPESKSRSVPGEDDKTKSDHLLSKFDGETVNLTSDSESESKSRSVSGEDDAVSSDHKSKSSDLLQQLHEAINIPVDESSSDKSNEEVDDSTEDITWGQSDESSREDTKELPAGQLPVSTKASKVFKESYFEDPGKGIDSEPDIPDEALDTDDECSISDSEKFLAKPFNTDCKDEHEVSDSEKEVEVKRLKSKSVQKLVTDQWTIDSDCEISGQDLVTDDELDTNFNDAHDDQTSTEVHQEMLTRTDELLNLHKLFDEARCAAQPQQHSQNLDSEENIVLSISSDSEVELDFSSDEECSLSNFDLTSCNPIVPGNEFTCVKSPWTSATVPVVNQPPDLEPFAALLNDQNMLKARPFSINVCDSFLGDHAIKKKSVTLLTDRNLFCGPCQKHFKNVLSLDKHEREYHSLNA